MLRCKRIIRIALGVALVFCVLIGTAPADSGPLAPFPMTRQVLGELLASGQAALAHYRLAERQARIEDQPYIADLFRAVATSQTVMNRNFRALLAELGGEVAICTEPLSRPSTTRRNLIVAIQHEIRETDRLFPQALARISREGHREAMDLLQDALRAQQLRRSDMREIHMGARYFYSRLQKEVRRRATVYYICQHSGALLVGNLPAVCPVRGAATTSYRALQRIPVETSLHACRAEAKTDRL